MRVRLPGVITILGTIAMLGACQDDTDEPPTSVAEVVEDIVSPPEDTATSDVADVEQPDDVEAADTDGADVVDPGPPDLTERLEPGQVRAGVVTDEAALLTGPRAEGQLGDVKMYNEHVAFIIEAPGRAHGGYRYYGGTIIDSDVVREPADPRAGDFFNEVILSWNLAIFEPNEVEIVSDGEDGTAIVRFTGQTAAFFFADSFLKAILNPDPIELNITYEYILRPGTHHLEHRVTLENPTPTDTFVSWPLMLSNQGDGMSLWKRGLGFNFTDGDTEAFYLLSRHSSHALAFPEGPISLLLDYDDVLAALESSLTIPAGGSAVRTYERWVTAGGSAELEAALAPGNDTLETLSGSVTIPDTTTADAVWVAVRQDGVPMAVTPVDVDGGFSLELPAGDYQLFAYAPDHAESPVVDASTGTDSAVVALPPSGRLTVTVTDSEGQPVDARVMLIAKGDTPTPYAPEDVRFAAKKSWDWGSWGQVSAVGYAVGGEVTVIAPPGEYEVRITRGVSYTTATATVNLGTDDVATAHGTIDKVINTTGWMSADFHIHATRSPDSDTPYDVRARQAVTEDLDLPILTEHVQIGGLQPTLDKLGITSSLGVYGQEVTTFEYGHFNAFPLVEDELATNFGAIVPYDKRPTELFQAIRGQHSGDKIVQINHPRGGSFGAYFDIAKLDRDLGEGDPDWWDTNWDAIEVFNGGCGFNEEFEDWVALTNYGLAKTLAAGSDSHGEDDPPGMPRTWIQVDRAAVEADREALVDPVRSRKVFVSCGPFVRFETTDGTVGIGGRTGVNEEGLVSFRAEVQAPAWMNLTEVRLYRNGEVVDVVPIETVADGVRLDTELTDTPEKDAWYMLAVIGSGNAMPVHRAGPPNAFTNPIEVDVDGDGEWTAPALSAQ